ncbi:hypothetical protein D9M68_810050 [compost metagenome]
MLHVGAHLRHHQHQHQEPARQRHREAHREDRQLRRGAVQDAHGQVQRQQRGDHRQRQQQPRCEYHAAGARHRHRATGRQRRSPDGQSVEAVDQRAQHHQVAVQRQEQQHRDDIEEARQHHGLAAGCTIEERGERQAHLQADDFARLLHRGKDQAHDKAGGQADADLVEDDQQALEGVHRRRRQLRDGG